MPTIRAHCNTCGGNRNHIVLHSEDSKWEDPDGPLYGSDRYETLKCCGCDTIKLRHTSWFSEWDEAEVRYFPPSIFRRNPDWFTDLWAELKTEEEFVEVLLKEIYVALQNNLPNIATMGVRSLLEKIMILKVGDKGTFKEHVAAFEEMGHVSKLQRSRLEAILDAGHATVHRSYSPKVKDVITLLDVTEHIIESVFLHEKKIEDLKSSVPSRARIAKKAV